MNEPKIISVSVDVTLLKKELFKIGNKPNKENKVPQYVTLDLLLNRDGPDQFGNHYYVKQSNYVKGQSAEDRPKMLIIGNAKVIVGADGDGPQRGSRRPVNTAPAAKQKSESTDSDDSVPF